MEDVAERTASSYKIRRGLIGRVIDTTILLFGKQQYNGANSSRWYELCIKRNPRKLHALILNYLPDASDIQRIVIPTQTEVVAVCSQYLGIEKIRALKDAVSRDRFKAFVLEDESPLCQRELVNVGNNQNMWSFNNFCYLEYPSKSSEQIRGGVIFRNSIPMKDAFRELWNHAVQKSRAV